ncbi:hypothetical protein [Paenibacillus senegalensis]|uniref:hypothetical protein n=1 Tax=Paenibacillus senegalensis TaxID=1465766 RepID=UPI0002888559|nr:hypothetical protein [Paenibacillus senegalensis]
MFRSMLLRLFLLVLVFIGGLLTGIELMNEIGRSPAAASSEKLNATITPSPGGAEPEVSGGAAAPATSQTGGSPGDESANSPEKKAEQSLDKDSTASGLQQFRPEPGLHIQESLINKVLRKTGEAIHLLADGVVKVIAALLDGVSG